jgi:hypothetical protein
MNRNKDASRQKAVQIWTYPQALAAVPYIRSVMRSLRETWLEARSCERHLTRLAERPGRPDRAALLAQADASRAAQKAEQAHEDAAEELRDLGILSVDPLRGEALLPCVHQHILAWIHFDLFSQPALRSWRYHSDPADMERPITELSAHAAEHSFVW